MSTENYKSFYNSRRNATYGEAHSNRPAEEVAGFDQLREFVAKYHLTDKKCLEIGSSGGMFQDVVVDYYGTDISEGVAERYHKPYRVADGDRYPFEDEMFDAIWTIAVFEHIPNLQEAMLEIKRLLKPNGVCLFAPAWQCRPWAADGYNVRPYKDFGFTGKLVKASIPIRDNILWRCLWVFPKRVIRHLAYKTGCRYKEIRHRKLKANYETYWVSDADACNHIDPHDAILWFESHGMTCVSHPMDWRAFLVKSGPIIVQKRC